MGVNEVNTAVQGGERCRGCTASRTRQERAAAGGGWRLMQHAGGGEWWMLGWAPARHAGGAGRGGAEEREVREAAARHSPPPTPVVPAPLLRGPCSAPTTAASTLISSSPPRTACTLATRWPLLPWETVRDGAPGATGVAGEGRRQGAAVGGWGRGRGLLVCTHMPCAHTHTHTGQAAGDDSVVLSVPSDHTLTIKHFGISLT